MGSSLRILSGKCDVHLLALNFIRGTNHRIQADALNLDAICQRNILDIKEILVKQLFWIG
ncbi:hypothetical protein D3C81_2130230 [compost metagenome]